MADLDNKPIPKNALLEQADAEDEDVSVEITETDDAPAGAEAEAGGETEKVSSAESQEVEKEARTSGWVGKDEWIEQHGSERGWKPAEDYLDVRRNMMPILSKENKAMRAELAQIKAERDQEKKERAELNSKYERESLKAQIRQAREDNDWDKVDELTDKMLDLKVAAQAAPRPAATPTPVDPEVQRDYLDFAGRNPWLKTGTRLAKLFAVQLKSVMEAGAADSIPDALETAKIMLKSQFPNEFPKRTAMAEGHGEGGHNGNTTRSWSNLKSDIREKYEKAFPDMSKKVKEETLRNMSADYFRS